MSVSGEADAIKADAITRQVEAILKPMPGFVAIQRAVCNEEWAYERAVVFDSLDNFKGYMGSEAREKQVLPLLDEMSKLAIGRVHAGNRAFEEYEPLHNSIQFD
jgi:antibiotic biosynthesis monooxygenase (ABM) superfamily enzyme